MTCVWSALAAVLQRTAYLYDLFSVRRKLTPRLTRVTVYPHASVERANSPAARVRCPRMLYHDITHGSARFATSAVTSASARNSHETAYITDVDHQAVDTGH